MRTNSRRNGPEMRSKMALVENARCALQRSKLLERTELEYVASSFTPIAKCVHIKAENYR